MFKFFSKLFKLNQINQNKKSDSDLTSDKESLIFIFEFVKIEERGCFLCIANILKQYVKKNQNNITSELIKELLILSEKVRVIKQFSCIQKSETTKISDMLFDNLDKDIKISDEALDIIKTLFNRCCIYNNAFDNCKLLDEANKIRLTIFK